MLKKGDIIIILATTIIAVVLLALLSGRKNGEIVEVTVDTKKTLYSLHHNDIITFKTEYFENEIEIKNGQVKMNYSSCKDKLCVEHTPINKEGSIIVCLPNKVSVRILGNEKTVDEITQ